MCTHTALPQGFLYVTGDDYTNREMRLKTRSEQKSETLNRAAEKSRIKFEYSILAL